MASAGDAPLVLVTGASGFIAKYIIKQLQEDGTYRVRGTVRSLENETKVKPIKELCPEAANPVELVEADLTKEESWESAVKDCTYVIHTASPAPGTQPENAEDANKPAVEGTLAVLKACQKARVQRVVLTSSFSAMWASGEASSDKQVTEETWASQEKNSTYEKSKFTAEKAAWDFVKELSEEEKFELAVINPTYVQGPVLTPDADVSSAQLVKNLLERQTPAVPKMQLQLCDVRDVAQAHIKAMTVPEAAGQRHIVCAGQMWMKEVAQLLSKEFKSRGYSVPTMGAPYVLVWFKGQFDKKVKAMLPSIGKQVKLDTSRMTNVLGIEPRDLNETLIETAYSLIEQGIVKKAKKYRARGEEEPKPEVKADVAVNGTVPKEGEDAEKKGEEEGEKKVEGEEKKEEEGDNKETEQKEEAEQKQEEAKEDAKEEEKEEEKKDEEKKDEEKEEEAKKEEKTEEPKAE